MVNYANGQGKQQPSYFTQQDFRELKNLSMNPEFAQMNGNHSPSNFQRQVNPPTSYITTTTTNSNDYKGSPNGNNIRVNTRNKTNTPNLGHEQAGFVYSNGQQDFNHYQNGQPNEKMNSNSNDRQQMDAIRPNVSEMIDQKIKSSIDQQMNVVKAYFETILAKIDIPPSPTPQNSMNKGSSLSQGLPNINDVSDKIKKMPKLTTLQAHCISVGPEADKEDLNQNQNQQANGYRESASSFYPNQEDGQKNQQNNREQASESPIQPHVFKDFRQNQPEKNQTASSSNVNQLKAQYTENKDNVPLPSSNMPKCEPPSYDAHMKKNPDLPEMRVDTEEIQTKKDENSPSFTITDEIPICPSCGRAFDSRDLLEVHFDSCLE